MTAHQTLLKSPIGLLAGSASDGSVIAFASSKMQNRRLRFRLTQSGFSLIEILAAMAIFTVGMLAVMSLFPVAGMSQRASADDTLGNIAGRDAMALIKLKGVRATPLATGTTVQLPTFDIATGTITLGGIDFTADERQWPTSTVSPNIGYPTANSQQDNPSTPLYRWLVAYYKKNAGDPAKIFIFIYRPQIGYAPLVSSGPPPTYDWTNAGIQGPTDIALPAPPAQPVVLTGQIVIASDTLTANVNPGDIYHIIRSSNAVPANKVAANLTPPGNVLRFPDNVTPVAVYVGTLE